MFRATCLIGVLAAFPVTASAQQPCTADARRVVAEVYQRVLERSFDPQGEPLVTQLQAGQTTVRDIVRAVAKSSEHQQRFLGGDRQAAVSHLYQHLLGRDPDPNGLRDNVAGANAGGVASVVDVMLDSGEYAQNFGDYGVPGSSVRYCGPGQVSADTRRNNRQMRFAAMDSNNNGSIERSEWNGTREAFVVEDWNGDNVLSGEEVRTGARRAVRRPGNAAAPFSSWDATTFNSLDRNRDGRIAAAEWQYDTASFVQADRNGDGILARTEFLNAASAPAETTENEFTTLDVNRNGRVERSEWRSSADAFEWLDRNDDNILSRAEVLGNRAAGDRFNSLDADGDGRLTPSEFGGTRRGFNQQDANRDGFLTRREFNNGGAVPTTGQ